MQNKLMEEFESRKNKTELDKNHILNDVITANEILDALKIEKNKISSSIDLISNEMLKNGHHFLLNLLEFDFQERQIPSYLEYQYVGITT
jgi:hypothetical protein